MRAVRPLFIYLAVVFLGGALLAPWLYHLVQWAATGVPALEGLANNPFHRYVNRSLLALALLGLWPLLRALGVRSFEDVGLVKLTGHWHSVARGFAVGFCSLACVVILVLVFGAREIKAAVPLASLCKKLAAAAVTAVVVAVLEEILFRGAIFGALRRVWRWPVALLVASALYAIVHFFGRPEPETEVGWATGLAMLPGMLQGFLNVDQVVPGFFTLTLVGVVLALAYQRTGNLYFSIGLHGGWIFWLKSYGMLTEEMPGSNTGLWGTYRMTDGWLALGAVAVCLVVVHQWTRSRVEPALTDIGEKVP
jgi:membrane protease YdiL (CAAX protease family)